MNTKEAMGVFWRIYMAYPEYEDELCKVAELLKHLEKYEKMWEEHKEGIIFLSGDAHYKGAKILMDRIEHKYFPK